MADIVRGVGLDQLLDDLIDALAARLREHDPEITITHDRNGFHYDKPDLGLVEWMPALEAGRQVSVKTVAYHPNNPVQRGLPSVLATTTLHDITSGALLALTESTLLTALRTGAASALATDVLATDGPVEVGVIGAGAQAVTQIHAISRVRPVARVLVTDTDPAVAASLVDRVAFLGIEVVVIPCEQVARMVAEVDVLCTCTSVDPGCGPVFADGDHRPWLHINAVGADFAGKVEVPIELLLRALVCPDVVSQCLLEGECQQLHGHPLGPDLANLVRDAPTYRSRARDLTVFDSTGWSLEDLVAAEVILGHAERLDAGVLVDLNPALADPYDPYGLLRGDGLL